MSTSMMTHSRAGQMMIDGHWDWRMDSGNGGWTLGLEDGHSFILDEEGRKEMLNFSHLKIEGFIN